MNYKSFLATISRDDNNYLNISSHRKYQHDEQEYDKQYKISPHDYLAGKGLFNLAKSIDLDVNNPILELGCGTGRLSVGLLKAFDPAKLLITDASSIFLDIARTKFTENGLDLPNLGILRFEDIGILPDDTFSLIVIRSALHHIDKYDEFLLAASQKLARGGAIVFQEPLYEGLFTLGLIAKCLQRSTNDKDVLNDLQLLSDTMRFYCRTDVDKSAAEDKYAFRLSDILIAANRAELSIHFFPNHSFEDFADTPAQFDYSVFAENYLKYCMGFCERTVSHFKNSAGDILEYIAQISGTNRAPESSGVFVLRRSL